MSDTIEIAREIAKEFADRTNERIEQTNDAVKELANQMGKMAEAVTETSRQLARYEERQTSATERMERLDQGLKEQGVRQQQFQEKTNERFNTINQQVRDNSQIRTVIVWLAGIVLTAAIGGGVLFGDFTGKGKQNGPHQQQSNSVP
jgi:histone H3/H4